MKRSLITAYYKNELMTQDFLNNLNGKLPPDTEVILVNAGSETIQNPIVDKRVDLPVNHSFSNSFNTGITAATGNYICIINNDAFPQTTDWLDKLIELQKKTKTWIVAPQNDKTLMSNYKVIGETDKYWEVEFFPAVCWLMSPQCLNRIGLFDERFLIGCYEDNDYCERVKKAGGNIIVSKDVTINHLESQTMNLFDATKVSLDNYNKFVKKHS